VYKAVTGTPALDNPAGMVNVDGAKMQLFVVETDTTTPLGPAGEASIT